jgi:hypothetical protein
MEELKQISIRMSKDLYDQYKMSADKIGVPVSNLMVMALAERLDMKRGIEALDGAVKMAQLKEQLGGEGNPFISQIKQN